MPEKPIDRDTIKPPGEKGDPNGPGRVGGVEGAGESSEPSAQVEDLEKNLAQLKDQLLRKAAEFDNYKKRTESEIMNTIRFANEDLLMKLLPVLDDFERSLKALGSPMNEAGDAASKAGAADDQGQKRDAFIHGIRLIHGKFRKLLEQVGLKPFDSAGKSFDPGLHDALLQVPREDLPHHTVVEEIEKGYMLHDRVIRHARVIVSSQSAGAAGEEGEGPATEEGRGD